nr:lysosomal proton-coupled steroid conjugate and bile acid symporter SLC46A3 [Nerophis lumbriciformis]
MKGLYLVEPVVALYAFSSYLTYPLVQQYVYRRLWQQLTNSTYPISDMSTCAAANSSDPQNHTYYFQKVQEQASLFSLYTQILSVAPSLLVTLLLVAYSDRAGRKVAIVLPLVGTLLYTLSLLLVSYLQLNIYLLVGASLLFSLFGGLGTFLGGCFAYVADLSGGSGRKMTLRIAGLDMMIGLLSGVAALSTGYFLRATGFNGPFLTSAACQVLVLLYAIFFLEETVTRPADAEPDRCLAVRKMFSAIYGMFAHAGAERRMLLALLLLIFTSLSFTYVGSFSLLTLYELNEPLCWTEILIGYGAALSSSIFLFSFLGVAALTYCGAPQLLTVLVGILSLATGMIIVAFSKTTLMMFLARVPMFLSIMPFAVLRSMMSKIISKSEQGALFALLSFTDVLTANVSVAVFNTLYATTVSWYPGLAFLLGAGLCAIPTIFLGVVYAMGADLANDDTEIANEEEGERGETDKDTPENSDDREPLLS